MWELRNNCRENGGEKGSVCATKKSWALPVKQSGRVHDLESKIPCKVHDMTDSDTSCGEGVVIDLEGEDEGQ